MFFSVFHNNERLKLESSKQEFCPCHELIDQCNLHSLRWIRPKKRRQATKPSFNLFFLPSNALLTLPSPSGSASAKTMNTYAYMEINSEIYRCRIARCFISRDPKCRLAVLGATGRVILYIYLLILALLKESARGLPIRADLSRGNKRAAPTFRMAHSRPRHTAVSVNL